MPKTFGQLIESLRTEKGWSVYALAQRSGLSSQAIHDLEGTDRQPSLETARRLAKALGVGLDWMIEQLPDVELPSAAVSRPRGRPPKQPPADVLSAPKRRQGRTRKGGDGQ